MKNRLPQRKHFFYVLLVLLELVCARLHLRFAVRGQRTALQQLPQRLAPDFADARPWDLLRRDEHQDIIAESEMRNQYPVQLLAARRLILWIANGKDRQFISSAVRIRQHHANDLRTIA